MVLTERQTQRSMEQMEYLKINPHKYAQLISDKDAKAIQQSLIAFSTKGAKAITSTGKKKN